MKKIILTVIILTMLFLVGCRSTPESPLLNATTALSQGRHTDAMSYFEETVASGEDLALAWRGIGFIHFQRGEFQEAFNAIYTALEFGAEESPVMYNVLGASAFQVGDYTSAIDFLNRGISMIRNAPNQWPYEQDGAYRQLLQTMMFNRFVAVERTADWARAYTLVQEYLTIFPEDTQAVREAEFLSTR